MTRPVTVPALVGYLEVHARWAANTHGAFAEFCEDIRQLRAILERATGRVRNPVKAGAACFVCSGDLVRRITDEGLEEETVTCSSCREQYDPARYNLALKAAAEAASRVTLDGEQWATPAALATDLGCSEAAVRIWRHREHVRGRVIEGHLFVSVADAQSHYDTRRSA